MPIHAPDRRRERILVYGEAGAGKSSTWTSLVQMMYVTSSTAKVGVIDDDHAWEAMRPLDGHLDRMVSVRDVFDWNEYIEAIREYRRHGKPDDLLVIDRADRLYAKAKQGFIEKHFNQSADAFYVQALGSDGEGLGGAYGKNWDAINNMYFAFIEEMQRCPGHVIATAACKEVRRADPKTGKGLADSTETILEYGDIGYKPAGHKDLPHAFHTVLFMQQSPSAWRMTTAKDRNAPGAKAGDLGFRPYLKGAKVDSFVTSYLVKVAGWRP